jgi:hypothetical protein
LKPLREEGGLKRNELVWPPATFGFSGEDTKAVETDRIIGCWGNRGESDEEVRGLAMGTEELIIESSAKWGGLEDLESEESSEASDWEGNAVLGMTTSNPTGGGEGEEGEEGEEEESRSAQNKMSELVRRNSRHRSCHVVWSDLTCSPNSRLPGPFPFPFFL